MTPIGRAVAMLTLYLEHADDSVEIPELEAMVDSIPSSELIETVWELLSCARAAINAAPNDEVALALRALALSAARWEVGQ